MRTSNTSRRALHPGATRCDVKSGIRFTKIFRASFLLYAPQAVNPVASALLILLIAHRHGTKGIAAYSLAASFMCIGQALAALGSPTPIIRTVALDRTSAAACLTATATTGLLAGSATIVGGRMLLNWLGYPEYLQTIITVGLFGILPSVVSRVCEAILIPLEKTHYAALAAIGENAAKVAGSSILLLNGHSILAIVYLIVFLRVLTCCAELFALKHTLGTLLQIDKQVMKSLLSVTPVFAVGAVLDVIVLRGDVILLSRVASINDVGLYSAAARVVFLALPLGVAFARALLPPMRRHSAISRPCFDELSHRSIRYVGIFAAAVTLGLCLFASPVVSVLYGAQFLTSISILMVMSAGLVPALLSTVYGSILFATDNEGLDLISKIPKMVVLFALVVLVCPKLGALGMAIAWVGSQFSHFAAQRMLLATRQLHGAFVLPLWRPVCALLGALGLFGAATWLHCPFGPMISLGAFLLLSTALKVFSDSEKRAVRSLYRRLIAWSQRSLAQVAKP